MNEDFLHRIRVRPPPKFLARLKSKLDRQPLHPPPRLARSVLAALLAGASALALAALALRGEFAGLHWGGWAHQETAYPPTAGSPATDATRVPQNGWLNNPWRPAVGQTTPARPRKSAPRGDEVPVVPVPQSGVVASAATAAGYNSRGAPLAHGGERLRIALASHGDDYANTSVKGFAKAGFNAPQVAVMPVDRLLGHLCADNSIDIAGVTRRMTSAEAAMCNRSGAGPMVEVKYGYQALALVRSKLYGALPLSPRDIYLALARTVPDPANPAATVRNPYTSWNEVNPSLPPDRIQVFGPPPTSETGELFVTLLMETGCNTFASMAALQGAAHDAACREVRDDGVYADAPEPYSLFEQRMQMSPTAVGVMGYVQLRGSAFALSPVSGIVPSQQTIRDGSYPGSRTLYLYVNKSQARRLTTLRSFLLAFLAPLEFDGRIFPYAERVQIFDNAFDTLGYPPLPPLPGEQR